MRQACSKRPWLFVVFAFVALIAAWVVLIVIAERHRQVEIPLPPPTEAKP